MKKLVLYTILLLVTTIAFAQIDTSALYYKYPDVPPFTIIKVPDSTKFVKADLDTKKSTIIMIFSPDCEHCQHEVKELKANINLFKNTQIVLVSYLDFHFLKTFYTNYKIADYPNISVGYDSKYFFVPFFKAKFFPAIFVYNKKGKLIDAFDGSVAVQKIAAIL